MSVTIKDIARQVGKSITTVSRALNGYEDVSPATRLLIQQKAAELGYTPNTYAQRLQKQRTDTIGFVIPTFGPRFSDPFFSEFIAGLGNTAGELGFDILVSTRPPGEKEMATYRAKVAGRQVDGFVIIRTRRNDPRIDFLSEIDFPFVAFGRTSDNKTFPFVDEDSLDGMVQVVRHLTGQGHIRIACIAPPPEFTFGKDRRDGFRIGLQKAAVPLREEYLRTGDLTQRDGYRCACELLDLAERPTAIAACNDLMAFGAIRAASERGLKIGQDIAITGFDDIPMAEHADPPLTTVHQPIYKIGTLVCEMLVQLITTNNLDQPHVVLKPSLVIRQSTGLTASATMDNDHSAS